MTEQDTAPTPEKVLPVRHTFVFGFQRREPHVDYYTSICKCGLPMDHFVHPGEHWFVFSFQRYDEEAKKWVDYCRKCGEPRTAPNHFGQPDRDPKQPYTHTHAAGDIVRDRPQCSWAKGHRYEILAVVDGGYHVKKLFSDNTGVEEFVWRFEGLEQSCELERSAGPSPLAEELAHTRDQVRQWRSAYFALVGRMDHLKDGEAVAMIARMTIQAQMWHRGELDTTSAMAGIYGELIGDHKLPPIDENLKELKGSSS